MGLRTEIHFKINRAPKTALLCIPKDLDFFTFEETSDINLIDGSRMEVWEEREEVDGTPMPQYGVSTFLQSLIVRDAWADKVRKFLEPSNLQSAQFRIDTQFESYTGFRTFARWDPTTTLPIYRQPQKSSDDSCPQLGLPQYYSEEFCSFIKGEVNYRGLQFFPVEW